MLLYIELLQTRRLPSKDGVLPFNSHQPVGLSHRLGVPTEAVTAAGVCAGQWNCQRCGFNWCGCATLAVFSPFFAMLGTNQIACILRFSHDPDGKKKEMKPSALDQKSKERCLVIFVPFVWGRSSHKGELKREGRSFTLIFRTFGSDLPKLQKEHWLHKQKFTKGMLGLVIQL